MILLLFLYLAFYIWLTVVLTKASVKAWKHGGKWWERILYPCGALYCGFRAVVFALFLWDVIGALLAGVGAAVLLISTRMK